VTRVLVIGNGVAGFSCARALSEQGADVTMIGPGRPYDRPPLTKHAMKSGVIPWLSSADGLSEMGVTWIDAHVREVELGPKACHAAPGPARDEEVLYGDALVLATGLRYVVPPVLTPVDPIVPVTPEALYSLRAGMERGRRIVIVGAGLIGCEAAATLASHHDVTLIDQAERPVDRLHDPLPGLVEAALERAGVSFVAGARLTGARRDGDGALLELADHGTLRADVAIAAAGTAGALPSGVPSQTKAPDGRSVLVDPSLRVRGYEDVYAVGDCATIVKHDGTQMWFPQWNHARAGGAHVARSLKEGATPFAELPYWYSNIGDLRIQEVGDAGAARRWESADELNVGTDAQGRAVAVLLLNQPGRLRAARELIAA
jgi:3-phenylpropionate/trans-cinnamate dioxygenase ferredoxin reductase component